VRLARWRALALALAALALGGCETTAEESMRLQHQAKHVTLDEKGLSIARQSRDVRVHSATIVRDSERAAAVVTLRNDSSRAQRDVPIAITVTGAGGRTVFQNDAPGLEGALVSVSSIAPRATVTWVDDQLLASGAPESLRARVGQSASVALTLPKLTVAGARVSEDPANGVIATGTVANHSHSTQKGLVLFAVARRAGKVVAAGRAIVPELSPNRSTSFQASLVGNASGVRLEVQAPPASFE
jgi:hypothetical protein